MKRDQNTELMLAAAFGTLSGMRTMSGPAIAAFLRTLNEDESGIMEDRLNGQKAVSTLGLLALGEIVADKLPGTGDRTGAIQLLGRALAGSLAGALVCSDDDPERVIAAAGVGAITAVASAFAAFHLRRAASDGTAIPDPVFGLIEDAIVYGSGLLLVQQLTD